MRLDPDALGALGAGALEEARRSGLLETVSVPWAAGSGSGSGSGVALTPSSGGMAWRSEKPAEPTAGHVHESRGGTVAERLDPQTAARLAAMLQVQDQDQDRVG